MNRLLLYLVLFIIPSNGLFAQNKDSLANIINHDEIYSFIIEDSPARLFTMRQFDEGYEGAHRLISRMMSSNFSPILNYTIQAASFIFAFGPLTHEEGHRSILISKNIGSISQPFFLSKRGGYIEGVTDSTLINLRDKDFPDYIRLYVAGLESDYMLTHREETLLSFEDDTYKNLVIEYLLRKLFIMQYYLIGFVKYDVDGNEETDELKRDIVGNDVYGAIRHLHRPTMPFYRYTRYNDLTAEEKGYLNKVGFRSLFNLVNLNIVGIRNFNISDNFKANFGMGYSLCPFGDFIDENLWVKYKNQLHLNAYLRQFQNRSKWFLAGGIGISDYPILRRISLSVDLHLWNQPAHLSFNENKGQLGGAVDAICRYFIFSNQKTKLKAFSIDMGVIYKTYGYLPEEIIMRRHFGLRFGASFALGK